MDRLPESLSVEVNKYARAAVLREFREFAREALQLGSSRLGLAEIKARLRAAIDGSFARGEANTCAARHLYIAAAERFSVDYEAVLASRCTSAVNARWAVWMALWDAGWSYPSIAGASHPTRRWNHGSVVNAVDKVCRWSNGGGLAGRKRAERIMAVAEELRQSLQTREAAVRSASKEAA